MIELSAGRLDFCSFSSSASPTPVNATGDIELTLVDYCVHLEVCLQSNEGLTTSTSIIRMNIEELEAMVAISVFFAEKLRARLDERERRAP